MSRSPSSTRPAMIISRTIYVHPRLDYIVNRLFPPSCPAARTLASIVTNVFSMSGTTGLALADTFALNAALAEALVLSASLPSLGHPSKQGPNATHPRDLLIRGLR